VIGSMTIRTPDLLDIGDNVSIGNAVNFENARVERGRLILGQIALDDDACVSSYAILEGNTRVGRRGHLEGQSALPTARACRTAACGVARPRATPAPSTRRPCRRVPRVSRARLPAKRCSSCSACCWWPPCSSCRSSPASC
jgi:hypothetical protein